VLVGPATTIPYHRAILESPDFLAGKLSTHFIDAHPELLENMQRFLNEPSPLDYGPDPRHVAAAAAAAAVVAGAR
jgi:pyruvate carboxylase